MSIAEALKRTIGEGAKPTAHLRILSDGRSGRLQQAWRGPFGIDWVDVPIVEVPVLPPRYPVIEETPAADQEPASI